MRRLLTILVFLLFACQSKEVNISPPQYYIEVFPVQYVWDTDLVGNAAASWIDGKPIIFLHPDRFPEKDPNIQHWIILHELAHLYAPGGLHVGGVSEIEADCIALEMMEKRQLLSDRSFVELLIYLQDLPGYDKLRHPSGSTRAYYLSQCYFDMETFPPMSDANLVKDKVSQPTDPMGRIRGEQPK